MRTDCKYPSDLSDGQWRMIKRLLPKWNGWGRRPICRRRVVNAILYVVRTGCQWRQLPHDFPHWKTVYNIFWTWRDDGTEERIHNALREKVRKSVGKKPTPAAVGVGRRGGIMGLLARPHAPSRGIGRSVAARIPVSLLEKVL